MKPSNPFVALSTGGSRPGRPGAIAFLGAERLYPLAFGILSKENPGGRVQTEICCTVLRYHYCREHLGSLALFVERAMHRNMTTFRMASRMRVSFLLTALGTALWIFSHSRSHAESPGNQLATELTQNVVQVRAKWGGKSQDGFGFVFGVRDGLLHIVTASKVVRASRGEIDRAPGIIFSRFQGTPIRGKLLEISSPATGLAVIEIESAKVPGYGWTRDVVAATSSIDRGADLWFVGSDRKWLVPSVPGKVLDVIKVARTDYSGTLIIAGGLNPVGSALGAPLVSNHGIVGMIISDSNRQMEAIPVEIIEATLRSWGQPWLLSVVPPKQDCDRMAASPDDLGRPSDVAGVSLDQLDVEKGKDACFLMLFFSEKIPRFTFQAGRILQAEGRLKGAESLYAVAAEKGYPAAQSALGSLYEMQGKEKDAVDLYRRSAEKGDPVGQTNLATMLRDEYGGVLKDDDAAVRLYKEAGAKNYPAALSSLGWMYEQGRVGGAANEAEARRLYEQAAARGDPYAQRALDRLDPR